MNWNSTNFVIEGNTRWCDPLSRQMLE